MKISIFDFGDYKKFLNSYIKENKNKWGIISQMADAAGCQRSYLSRVINEEVQLTPDHAYNLSSYLGLNEIETEYFLLILEKERASTINYKKKIESKIQDIKKDQENLKKVVKRDSIEMDQKSLIYYSTWLWSALHIIVSIPQFQTAKAIATKLQVDINLVEQSLQTLQTMGLIKYQNQKWQYASGEIHISKDSPLSWLHHSNWRQRALLDMQSGSAQSLHYTVVQSMDKVAYEKIKKLVIGLIKESSEIAGPAPSEELVCLACDLFEI